MGLLEFIVSFSMCCGDHFHVANVYVGNVSVALQYDSRMVLRFSLIKVIITNRPFFGSLTKPHKLDIDTAALYGVADIGYSGRALLCYASLCKAANYGNIPISPMCLTLFAGRCVRATDC